MTRTFAVKAWLGGSGLLTGLLGMAMTQRWLVWLAVTLLGVAFTLRFAERRAHGP